MKTMTILHLTTPLDAPICPKCGSGHEDDGGTVSRGGSWDHGPFYWQCDTCIDDSDGYPNPMQWGHA